MGVDELWIGDEDQVMRRCRSGPFLPAGPLTGLNAGSKDAPLPPMQRVEPYKDEESDQDGEPAENGATAGQSAPML